MRIINPGRDREVWAVGDFRQDFREGHPQADA